MAAAIMTKFETVPKPGLSFSGNQSKRTTALIKKVDSPIDNGVCRDNPCASTDQGAFPICDWINSESPNPKTVSAENRMSVRLGVTDQRCEAVQGVRGMVLAGLRKWINRAIEKFDGGRLTVRVYTNRLYGWM